MSSWVGHALALAKTGRDVLQYETRGQGKLTTLPVDNCDLEQQVFDFGAMLDTLVADGVLTPDDDGRVDLAGFSFGGRVVLAIAARLPHRVRRCVVTGVPADRGPLGRTVLRAWLSCLDAGALDAFVWQSMVEGHSTSFLARHERRLAGWVEGAVKANRCDAIRALIAQTHHDDEDDPFHSVNLAKQTAENLGPGGVQLLAAGDDRIAPAEEVARLAELAGGWPVVVVPGAGHSLPIEQPKVWRRHLLDFLDAEDTQNLPRFPRELSFR